MPVSSYLTHLVCDTEPFSDMSDKKSKKDESDLEEEDAAPYDAYATEKDKGKIMAIASLRFRFLPVIDNQCFEYYLLSRLDHI